MPQKPNVQVKVHYKFNEDESALTAVSRLLVDGKEIARASASEPLPDQIEGWGWLKKGWKSLTRTAKKAARTIYKGTKQVLRSKVVKQLFNLAQSPAAQGALSAAIGPQGAAAVTSAMGIVRPSSSANMQLPAGFPMMPQMMQAPQRRRPTRARRRRMRVVRRKVNPRRVRKRVVNRSSKQFAPKSNRAAITISPNYQFLLKEVRRLEDHIRWLRK